MGAPSSAQHQLALVVLQLARGFRGRWGRVEDLKSAPDLRRCDSSRVKIAPVEEHLLGEQA